MYNSLETFNQFVDKKTENNRWDYKRDIHINPNYKFAEILKDILAFANSGGGWLVLGVDDEGEIVGVEEKIDPTSLGSKITDTINSQVMVDLNYYKLELGEELKTVGLLYVHDSDRILLCPKDISNSKNKPIIKANSVYFRRNASSTIANKDDYDFLIEKMIRRGSYKFEDDELKIIARNNRDFYQFKRIKDFYEGKFQFNAFNFSEKIKHLYFISQPKYTKYEMGVLLGFEIDHINDYFESRRLPKLEHILRAVEIFKLPHDYFFQPTFYNNMPFKHNPLISYVLFEKVSNKVDAYDYGYGKLLKEVFLELSSEFATFKKWLYGDRYKKKGKDDIEYDFFTSLIKESKPTYTKYDKYLEELNDKQYTEFKSQLGKQYYKELERVSDHNERNLTESIFIRLASESPKVVCKFISELIKEINIVDGIVRIEFNFLYEVQNQLIRYRSFDPSNLKVNFDSEDESK